MSPWLNFVAGVSSAFWRYFWSTTISPHCSQGVWPSLLFNLLILHSVPQTCSPAISFQFLSGVDAWCKMCSEGGLPSEMQDLELAIHHHQSLYEQVTQAYTEVRTWRTIVGLCVLADGAGVLGFVMGNNLGWTLRKESFPLSRGILRNLDLWALESLARGGYGLSFYQAHSGTFCPLYIYLDITSPCMDILLWEEGYEEARLTLQNLPSYW